jgi:hypothetical protein
MDALAKVRNEAHLHDVGLLQSFSVLAACSSVAHPTAPVPLTTLLVALLLLVVKVLIFTMIIVVEMDMWSPSSIGREKLRRLMLVVLYKVLVGLVLEDLRAVLVLERHMRCSYYFIALRPLRRQELLIL